ncbi:MAG TPA: NAD(P)-dependent oxidoreductase [Reyranellaceae bacterium]|nr:NAD(P)-dependent oxidoreductase [Reyranellaceae bacterium]
MGKIAVLGGTGLIGRHVVELLAAGATEVAATFHSRPAFEARGVEWRRADLREPPEAAAAVRGARTVILCAGRVATSAELRRDPVTSVMETLRIGINGLEAAAKEGVDHLVLLSSCTGYPEGSTARVELEMFKDDPPAGWFGVGWMHRYLEKQLQWFCQLGRIASAVALRPTLVYGPHDDFSEEAAHFLPSFVRRVVERQSPIEIWGDGEQTRNLIHAADVARAVVASFAARPGFAAYNVAAPKSASLNDVLSMLLEADGFATAQVRHVRDRSSGASALSVSASAFAQAFDWRPIIGLREGLADTLAWYRGTLSAR